MATSSWRCLDVRPVRRTANAREGAANSERRHGTARTLGRGSPKCRSGTLARECWAEPARVHTDCATSTGGRVAIRVLTRTPTSITRPHRPSRAALRVTAWGRPDAGLSEGGGARRVPRARTHAAREIPKRRPASSTDQTSRSSCDQCESGISSSFLVLSRRSSCVRPSIVSVFGVPRISSPSCVAPPGVPSGRRASAWQLPGPLPERAPITPGQAFFFGPGRAGLRISDLSRDDAHISRLIPAPASSTAANLTGRHPASPTPLRAPPAPRSRIDTLLISAWRR